MPLWAKWVIGVSASLIVAGCTTVLGTGFALVSRMSALETAQDIYRSDTLEEFKRVHYRLDKQDAKIDKILDRLNGKTGG